MPKTVQLSRHDQVATITFNRPEAMNTFNKDMAHDLATATEEVKNDDTVRAVILNGAGHLFMAGGDLQFFYESLDTMPNGVDKLIGLLNTSVKNLLTMPKPVVASVHGSVAGAGISLMLACDLIVAAESTKFTLAYSGIGLSPDGGATYLLPRAVGSKKAMQWLMLSDVFDAQTALAHGLINWAVPTDDLQKKTKEVIAQISNGPTQSYAHIKRLVNDTWHMTLDEHLQQEGDAFASCTTTNDFKTGVTSFLQKKQAVFSGN